MHQDLFESPVQKKERNFTEKRTKLFFIMQSKAQ